MVPAQLSAVTVLVPVALPGEVLLGHDRTVEDLVVAVDPGVEHGDLDPGTGERTGVRTDSSDTPGRSRSARQNFRSGLCDWCHQ